MENITEFGYILASILFILGIKRLSSPNTARSGNALSSLGMLIAIIVTVINLDLIPIQWILPGLIIGGLIGLISARFVKMTAMPQMVAIFNGLGGGASGIVAISEYLNQIEITNTPNLETTITVMISIIIGSVTLTGSFVAFGKLQGIIRGQPILLPIRNIISSFIFVTIVISVLWMIFDPNNIYPFYVCIALCLLIGILLVIPIGGADMPVVVALLNSYSGLAAAATGFVLHNNMLIIAGSLVGASGIILTRIMTKAMNRSILNVMFGGFGSKEDSNSDSDTKSNKPIKSATTEDVAMMLQYAESVVIVPGYGLAVAQAQHQVRELSDILKSNSTSIKYAIHPVAGRMPGHMNVLLAEANVPYVELKDLDEINSEFQRTDVVIVIGANDVTNPAARNDQSSPIYGMPVLNVDQAQSVIVLKRSMASGFSGVENELFHLEKTFMLFGDAKNSLEQIISEIKSL
tara:strand:+ start:33112 stop:34500 length:1389 start_codon:yes stop_codon:yes gene_type:complete